MIEICGNGVECIHSAYNVMNIKHSEYRYLWPHSLIGLPQFFYAKLCFTNENLTLSPGEA